MSFSRVVFFVGTVLVAAVTPVAVHAAPAACETSADCGASDCVDRACVEGGQALSGASDVTFWYESPVGWTGVGFAVSGAIVGAVLLERAAESRQRHRAMVSCFSGSSPTECRLSPAVLDEDSSAEDVRTAAAEQEIGGWFAVGIAGAGLVTAIVAFLTYGDGPDDTKSSAVRLAPRVDPVSRQVGLQAAWTF